ncbi:MAG: BCCT family transporter [Verrucomicrobiota bacterium]|nr:BCCT family transporter [Verrucomicrobiota bacterium]
MQFENPKTDWFNFISTGIVIFIITLSMLLAPRASQEAIKGTFSFITDKIGLIYIWFGIAVLFFLLAIAFSSFGKIKLGLKNDCPEHSTMSWVAMIFSTGIGTTILYWGTIEWIEYYQEPPFEIQARTENALKWSTSYGMFHWGIIGWALYCFPAVCLGYAYHVRNELSLNLSSACRPVLRGTARKIPGRVVDILFMIGLLGSATTGIGLTTPLITESFGKFFNVEQSFGLTVSAIALVVAVIALSVYVGLERGIKKLSNIKIILIFIIIMMIITFGPTKYIVNKGIDSLFFMLTHLPEMSGVDYPSQNKAFTEKWTIFYWAWWLALGPFVGMFICKISRGRTLRQLILGVLFFGTLGCTICIGILSGYSLFLEQEQGMQIIDSFNQNKHSVVIQVLTSLPMGKWILPFFFLLCISFAATTYDSASYTLAAAATITLKPSEHPARWHRVVWAVVLGFFPLVLLSLGHLTGENDQNSILLLLQTASVAVSLPILLIGVIMAASLTLLLFKHGNGEK